MLKRRGALQVLRGFQELKHILRKHRDVARRNRQRGNVNVTLSRSNALPVCSSSFGRVPEISSGVAVTIFYWRFRRNSQSDIGSPFFHHQKKKRTREKHANGTAESGVFLLPSLPRAIIASSISRERIPIC